MSEKENSNFSVSIKTDTDGNYKYIGMAMAPNADKEDGDFWCILRLEYNNGDFVGKKTSNGLTTKNCKWSDRKTLVYK